MIGNLHILSWLCGFAVGVGLGMYLMYRLEHKL